MSFDQGNHVTITTMETQISFTSKTLLGTLHPTPELSRLVVIYFVQISLHFLELNINGITPYALFCAWPLYSA